MNKKTGQNLTTKKTGDLSLLKKHTEFQVYRNEENIIDFSQKKLERIIKETKQKEFQLTLCALLDDYLKNRVALAWRAHIPFYIAISNDK